MIRAGRDKPEPMGLIVDQVDIHSTNKELVCNNPFCCVLGRIASFLVSFLGEYSSMITSTGTAELWCVQPLGDPSQCGQHVEKEKGDQYPRGSDL